METRERFREYCFRHRAEVKYALFEDGLHIMEATWTLRDEQKAKDLMPTRCWADVTTHHPEKQYMFGWAMNHLSPSRDKGLLYCNELKSPSTAVTNRVASLTNGHRMIRRDT